jgi:hypothetical protein
LKSGKQTVPASTTPKNLATSQNTRRKRRDVRTQQDLDPSLA